MSLFFLQLGYLVKIQPWIHDPSINIYIVCDWPCYFYCFHESYVKQIKMGVFRVDICLCEHAV
jgi:hypothetical protein